MPSGKYWWVVRNTETGEEWARDRKYVAEVEAARRNGATPHGDCIKVPVGTDNWRWEHSATCYAGA